MERKKQSVKKDMGRSTKVKTSFKSLGKVGKCIRCGKVLDENMSYKTKYCDDCLVVRRRENKAKFRVKYEEQRAKRIRKEKVSLTDRQMDKNRRRIASLPKTIDPVVRRIDKGNGITVSERGHCFGGGGSHHVPSYMSSWM